MNATRSALRADTNESGEAGDIQGAMLGTPDPFCATLIAGVTTSPPRMARHLANVLTRNSTRGATDDGDILNSAKK
jgi:hypothetical protein